MLVPYSGSEEVLAALAGIGRTEDVQFSPDGKRLAIAGFTESRILILEIERMTATPAWDIRFSKATVLKSSSFDHPHGLAWADNEVLFVANRQGSVPVVKAPLFANAPELMVHPITTIGSSEADLIGTPGSVSLRVLGPDLIEVLICNNFVHRVTRHLVNRQGFSILASETVLHNGLNVPDGIAVSHSGKWVAVSNHYANNVHLYRTDQGALNDSPAGTLRGIGYPHGISFTPDDRAFFVADAGAPYVHLFAAGDGDWTGNRIPASSIKVMDNETFDRGHYNPEEGGPKGLTVSPDGALICLTHEEEPLVFVDIREELSRAGVKVGSRVPVEELAPAALTRMLGATMERSRNELGATLRREREAAQRIADAETRLAASGADLAAAGTRMQALEQERLGLGQRVGELEQHARSLEQQLLEARNKTRAANSRSTAAARRLAAMMKSSSWRLTAPLRAIRQRLSGRR